MVLVREYLGVCLLLFSLSAFGGSVGKLTPRPLPQLAKVIYSQTFFEPNEGQIDKRVMYSGFGFGYSLFLTRDNATLVLHSNRAEWSTPALDNVVRLSIVGASSSVELTGVEELPGKSNYFSGPDSRSWHTRVPHFARVRYESIYPGVDLVFYARQGQLEYDFEVAPGANPHVIRLKLDGGVPSLTPTGDVAIGHQIGIPIILKKPYIYQVGGHYEAVPVRYSLRGHEIEFSLGKYDHRRTLVIDPALIFATYLSSNCSLCTDLVKDLAVDASGIYVTGSTNATGFPASESGPQFSPNQLGRTFVTKLDPSGSQIIYTSFLDSSEGHSVAIDISGSAYIGGIVFFEGGSPFPTTPGVFSAVPQNGCPTDCQMPFAAKLSPDGSTLEYSTFLQLLNPNGQGDQAPQLIVPTQVAVDSSGALFITGTVGTQNNPPSGALPLMPLPTTAGAYQTTVGNGFVMKLKPTASGLAYSTYLGGSSNGVVAVGGIALDTMGFAYVAGSAVANYPTTAGAYQTTNADGTAGFTDGFVTKLSLDGSSLVYSTFLGGTGNDQILGVAVDSTGEAVAAGWGSVPNTGTPFVKKLSANGSALIYSTSLCGLGKSTAIALDSQGLAYVSGFAIDPTTCSLLSPIQGYVLRDPQGKPETMFTVAKLDPAGSPQWFTLLGAAGGDSPEASRIALDPSNAAFVLDVGMDAPTTQNSLLPQPGKSLGPSTFLAKIAPSLSAPVAILSPLTVSFGAELVGVSSSSVDIRVSNFGDAPMSPVISISGDFSQTNTCSGPVVGGQKCDVNVVFDPSGSGTRSGALTANFGGSAPPQSVILSGTGVIAAVSEAPIPLTFGAQAIGITSSPQQVTVTSTGTGPLTITSVNSSGDFSETNACGASLSPGSTCVINVTFTPTALGIRNGSLTLVDNASDNPQTVAITGTGSPPSLGLTISPGRSASATIQAGNSASYVLSIGGTGVSGAVSIGCAGAPMGATCSVVPATLAISGVSTSTFNVNVTTTSRTLPVLRLTGFAGSAWWWAIAIAGIVTLPKISPGKRPTKRSHRALLFFVLGMLCSCGGSRGAKPNPDGTPAGTYTLTITASSSSSASQSMALTLNVQ